MNHPIEAQGRLDRLIEWVSPALAARRYAARANIEMARSIPVASYRGAVASRFSSNWGTNTTYRGGSTKERRDLGTMRDRARRVYDENVIGGGLLDTETDNVVADGFSLQMLSGNPAFNAEAEDRFYAWLDRADISGMSTGAELFRDSWSEPRKDGDGGYVLIVQGGYPYLQYIPGDLIANPWGMTASAVAKERYDWRNTFDGIECNAAGRPRRFWVRDVDERGRDSFSPIDARDFVYLAYRRKKRSVRGTTVYSRVFNQLDQADAFIDAVTKAAIMGAIFGLVEKRKNPAAVTNPLGTTTNAQGEPQKVVSYENGMVKVLGHEDSLLQVQAMQPVPQAPDFIRALMRLICLAFDMPLEIGQKDLSQVNFSGGRIGLIAYYRSCRVKQDWLKSRCWNRIVYWWLSVERRRQELGYPDAFVTPFPSDYGRFELHGREWDYNDPETEAKADLLEMDMGILSEQQACERRGRDWRKTQDLIAAARKLKQDMAIPIIHSTSTRDETAKVTAVDADGNPVAGSSAPLNGVQITAAMDVIAKAAENTIPEAAALEMLARLGISEDKAKAIVAASKANRSGITASDREYQRSVLLELLKVPQAREAVFNKTDIEDLVEQTGLPPEKDYEVPWAAVVAPAGPLNSGAVVYDPDGDIVGGDVENDAPADDGGRGGSPDAAQQAPEAEGQQQDGQQQGGDGNDGNDGADGKGNAK